MKSIITTTASILFAGSCLLFSTSITAEEYKPFVNQGYVAPADQAYEVPNPPRNINPMCVCKDGEGRYYYGMLGTSCDVDRSLRNYNCSM